MIGIFARLSLAHSLSLLGKVTVYPQLFQTPSNSPLVRGRTGFVCLGHDEILCFPPLQGGTKGGSDYAASRKYSYTVALPGLKTKQLNNLYPMTLTNDPMTTEKLRQG
jgi:hypothetical protein